MRMKERLAAGCLCVVLLLGLPGCNQQSAPQQEISFVTVEDGSIQREQMMHWPISLMCFCSRQRACRTIIFWYHHCQHGWHYP